MSNTACPAVTDWRQRLGNLELAAGALRGGGVLRRRLALAARAGLSGYAGGSAGGRRRSLLRHGLRAAAAEDLRSRADEISSLPSQKKHRILH